MPWFPVCAVSSRHEVARAPASLRIVTRNVHTGRAEIRQMQGMLTLMVWQDGAGVNAEPGFRRYMLMMETARENRRAVLGNRILRFDLPVVRWSVREPRVRPSRRGNHSALVVRMTFPVGDANNCEEMRILLPIMAADETTQRFFTAAVLHALQHHYYESG